jgi:hypothetical protein
MSIAEPIHVNELPKPGEISRLKDNYIEGEPLKLILQDEQHLTETLWWPSKSNDENYILFVIPGNPGVIDYYVEFLSTVHSELGKKIDIVGGSYLVISYGFIKITSLTYLYHHDSFNAWTLLRAT